MINFVNIYIIIFLKKGVYKNWMNKKLKKSLRCLQEI